ncbi:MAG: M3 family peptidase, partial [Sphingomonas sp.]
MQFLYLAASAVALMASTSIVAQTGATSTTPAANPLLADWTGPLGGVPPWDKVRPDLFPQAFETTLAERAADYRKIADNPAKPT